MDEKNITFYEPEIEEYKFPQQKSPILINEIDINKIVVSNKFSIGQQEFKYFIGNNDNGKIKPLCMFFPETNGYRIALDETECMSF